VILEILSIYEESKTISLLDEFKGDIDKCLNQDFNNIYEKMKYVNKIYMC
jgi:hypothetical protein